MQYLINKHVSTPYLTDNALQPQKLCDKQAVNKLGLVKII